MYKKNIASLLSTVCYCNIVKFLALIICYRMIPAKELGLYIFANSLSLTLLIAANLSINLVLVREISRSPDKLSEHISSLISARALSAGLYFAVVLSAVFLFGYLKFIVYFLVIALSILLEDVYVSFNYVFIARNRAKYSVIIPVLAYTGFLLFLIVGLILKPRVESLIIAQLIKGGILITAAAAVLHFRIIKIRLIPDSENLKNIFRQIPHFLLMALSMLSYGYIAILWIGYLKGFAATVPFGIAFSIVAAFIAIPQVVTSVIYPDASRNNAAGYKDFSKIALFVISASIGLGVLVAVGSKYLLGAFFAQQSGQIFGILKILIWILPGLFLSNFFAALLQAKDREKTASFTGISCVVLNIIFSGINLYYFGIFGLAWTMVAVYSLQATLLVYATLRKKYGDTR